MECPICLEEEDVQLVLKCGHNFCSSCITQYQMEGGMNCPVCRAAIGKETGNIPSLNNIQMPFPVHPISSLPMRVQMAHLYQAIIRGYFNLEPFVALYGAHMTAQVIQLLRQVTENP